MNLFNFDHRSNRAKKGGDTMKKALVLSPFLVALFALSAVADDTLVKFRGGIGSSPSPAAWGRRPPPRS